MENIDDLSSRIVSAAMNCTDVEIINEARFGEGDYSNELIFFIKPEIFLLNRAASVKSVGMILSKLSEFKADIAGIYAISGSALDKHNIMAKHYGFINVMSTSASKIVDDQSREKISQAYNLGEFAIMGGHEYLKAYPSETPDGLDRLWFEDKSVKIRSGFYVRHIKKDGRDIVLVNGFHPKQLAYFTDPTHRIVLMLLHSNSAWGRLKNGMVGATFPDKAEPESMRGTFFRDAKAYGFESVTIANNCVHLSAGPFEGMFEIFNFFGKITPADLRTQSQPLILRKMIASGIGKDLALTALENPRFEMSGKQTDLFSATEDADTDKAIEIFRQNVG